MCVCVCVWMGGSLQILMRGMALWHYHSFSKHRGANARARKATSQQRAVYIKGLGFLLGCMVYAEE